MVYVLTPFRFTKFDQSAGTMSGIVVRNGSAHVPMSLCAWTTALDTWLEEATRSGQTDYGWCWMGRIDLMGAITCSVCISGYIMRHWPLVVWFLVVVRVLSQRFGQRELLCLAWCVTRVCCLPRLSETKLPFAAVCLGI